MYPNHCAIKGKIFQKWFKLIRRRIVLALLSSTSSNVGNVAERIKNIIFHYYKKGQPLKVNSSLGGEAIGEKHLCNRGVNPPLIKFVNGNLWDEAFYRKKISLHGKRN